MGASILGLVGLRLLGPDVLSQKTLSQWMTPLGELAPLAFTVFLAVRPLTLLPGQVFTAVGGMLFGTLRGSLYAMVGSSLAVALVFLLSQRFGKKLMKRLFKGRYQALKTVAERHDFKFALLATLNPLIPTDVAVAAAAASGARFWPTVGGVLLGTLPGTFLTAQFGSALSQGKAVMTTLSALGMVISLVLGVSLGKQVVQEIARAPETPPEPRSAQPHSALPTALQAGR